ncbi:MAG: glycosyltransferase family 39 protein [Phycisphaerales bacterium]|nr:glycosyltransferase family 39 protein [Phycisphaerales bacterium]
MSKRVRALLLLILTTHVVASVLGIRWGLPTGRWDACLFGDAPPWEGSRILQLAGGAWADSTVGADVDVDPLDTSTSRRHGLAANIPTPLNATEADQARLYLRYRLYTHQPDEMIVMRALGGMNPSQLRLDPRLYQYGGLFIYPVGALLKLCGAVGLIDVRGDVAFYLDHPDEFGKFYVVARAYSAAWGLALSLAAFAVARRLAGDAAGLTAAALVVLMPVTICMAHEGKPHLPGAALMLTAVWLAMRCTQHTQEDRADDSDARAANARRESRANARAWWLLSATCGAAVGMVLSSAPVCVLIPLAAYLRLRGASPRNGLQPSLSRDAVPLPAARWLATCARGGLVAMLAYLLTNPYIAINLFINRPVLASNFGNSLAMYEISRIGEGFLRVAELTAEGAGLPIALVGIAGWILWLRNQRTEAAPLLAVAGVLLAQFTLLGAGKPAEYGRFGVFSDAALAIGAGCVITRLDRAWLNHASRGRSAVRIAVLALTTILVAGTARGGIAYLLNFHRDEGAANTRWIAAAVLRDDLADEAPRSPTIAVLRAPAPYACPPVDFSRYPLVLYTDKASWQRDAARRPSVLIEVLDRLDDSPGPTPGSQTFEGLHATPISWANKPVRVTWSRGVEPQNE